jgi:hypothetical protein
MLGENQLGDCEFSLFKNEEKEYGNSSFSLGLYSESPWIPL